MNVGSLLRLPAVLFAVCALTCLFQSGHSFVASTAVAADSQADTTETDDDEKDEKEENAKGEEADSKASDDAKSGKSESEASKTKEKAAKAEKTRIERVVLSGSYVDLVGPAEIDPLSLVMGDGPSRGKSFYKLCDFLEELSKKDELEHVVFDLSANSLSLNLAQLDELLRRIDLVKQAGKKLAAWLENPSPTHLAIAAACDHVAMSDFGGIDMPSKSLQSLFYRDAMDLLGVKASVVRAGNFKGAVEPYLNSVMSDHLRDHYLDMLSTMNDAEVSMIAKGRGLTTDQVRDLQKQRVLLPKEALAAGLIDELAPTGTLKPTMARWAGAEGEDGVEWIEKGRSARKEMSVFELMGKMMSGSSKNSSRLRTPSIAVMHLSGTIVDGTSTSAGSIVSGPTVKAIRELIEDEKVEGVVVRINSPGGSATASEAIRQALLELEAKKPVVVSMGEMAASGGYWVSCLGVPVYAERGTITGSIGVFSMKISFGSLMKRVGVHVENIALDEAAVAFAPDRAWNEEDELTLQKTIDDVYSRFLGIVSESRGIDVDQLHDLAGGRVWSGTQAKQHGLVDEIGGLDDCLAVVAKKAELDDYEVVHRPQLSTGLDLSTLLGDSDEDLRAIGISAEAVELLKKRGLATAVLEALIGDVFGSAQGRPSVWALGPADLSIR